MKVLKNALNEKYVFFNLKANDKLEAISILSDKLKKEGIVKPSFKDAVINRENEFPTGLLLGETNVAIPHCDSSHVFENAVAIAKLEKPVIFKYMADPTLDVEVHFLFMLAIADPKKQVPVLSTLMSILSNQDNISELLEVNSSNELINLLIEKEN